jgi:radical SAM superfamily enzyme YgiQ (UPF0313 family)
MLVRTVDYIGRMFRPPSEARSLLLQVTVGCSHNRCSYCDMYRDKRFSPKPWATVEADIEDAAESADGPMGAQFRRVFLCDGDALILSTDKLARILARISERLPWVERVGVYGDTRSVKNKSVEDLRRLREAGLGIVYHGVETGDDEVMDLIDKGGTREECIDTASKLREAGIVHSVMVLLGVGGVRYSEQHARGTASLLSAMDPPFVGALTTTVVPGTPLHDMQQRGEFELPDKFTMLSELETIVTDSELSKCRFSANHASNYLPITADLPAQKEQLLSTIGAVIARGDDSLLKPEWLRGL